MASLETFVSKYYRPAHGPLVISICVFGIASQSMNIVILTRRPMCTMPSNILLAGLSVAQLILLTNYAIGTGYDMLDGPCNVHTKTYGWLAYLLVNVNTNLVFHTIALVHTTLLAVFRYAAVAFPIRCRKLVSERGAKLAVLSAFAIVPVACASFYANSTIVQIPRNESDQCPTPSRRLYMLKYTENRVLRNYNFIFFGAVFKVFPCAAMIVLSSLLLLELKRVRDKRERLMGQRNRLESTNSEGSKISNIEHNNNRHHRRTTPMLVTVVLLLVSVELPQGIINFLSVLLANYGFSSLVYAPLGDFFEMLTVLYSSVNFIIYCLMSSQFRQAFKRVFTNNYCLGKRSMKKGGGALLLDDSTWNGVSVVRSSMGAGRRRSDYSSIKRNDGGHQLVPCKWKRGKDTSIMYDSVSGAVEVTNSFITDTM